MKRPEAELQAFLTNPHDRNRWLKHGAVNVYMRKGVHYVFNKVERTIDIANVNVHPDNMRKGEFKAFLTSVETLCPGKMIYVENIHNEVLSAYLLTRGYKFIMGMGCLVCMYKEMEH